MAVKERGFKCSFCKIVLPDNHSGPCPECRKIGPKLPFIKMGSDLKLKGKLRLFWEDIEVNWRYYLLSVFISFLVPIVGYKLFPNWGMEGLLFSFIVALVLTVIGRGTYIKIRNYKSVE